MLRHCLNTARNIGARSASRSQYSAPAKPWLKSGAEDADPILGQALKEAFKKDPEAAVGQICKSLDALDKSLLVSALTGFRGQAKKVETEYVRELLRAADRQGSRHISFQTKEVVAEALKQADASVKIVPSAPTSQQLWRYAFAHGVPYIGFGFLDNFIMILAGEEIDRHLACTLGISTMAAAGLGNLISDAAGVTLAETLETQIRSLPAFRSPALTKAQRAMGVTRGAKMAGCMVGVSLGCLLGMAPLLWPRPKASSSCPESAA